MISKGRKNGTMRFSIRPTNGVKKIRLAGDFSNWEPIPMRKQKSGEYAVTIPLEHGTYHYKFFVDDHWLVDPDNEAHSVNEYGTLNSVICVE